MIAPLLPEILLTVSRIARNTQYSWELDTNTFVPSNSRSIARQVIHNFIVFQHFHEPTTFLSMQFVRCVLHQLSGNGIFSMIFHMDLQGSHRQKFFNTIVQCLLDFTELSPAVPVGTFFQEMNERKNISSEFLELSLPNLACYLSCIPFEQVNLNYHLVPISIFTFRPLTGSGMEFGVSSMRAIFPTFMDSILRQ